MIDLISINEKLLRINGIPYQKGKLYVKHNPIAGSNSLTVGSTLSGDSYSGTYDQFSNNGVQFNSIADFLTFTEENFFTSTISGTRCGSITLVSGTKTEPNTTVTANTKVKVQLKTVGGTLGVMYAYSVNAGIGFTINSVSATGTIVVTDNSTLDYYLT